jgi:hypothetical protein
VLILLLAPQGQGPQPTVDVRDPVEELYPQLGASGASDLEFWTKDELYRFCDDAAKRLARNVGCFVERNASIGTVVGQAEYSLPSRHLSTIHASYGDSSLLPATVEELEALDPAWTAAANDTPSRFVQRNGTEKGTLYPPPDTDDIEVALIQHEFPSEITEASPGVYAPKVMRDYFRFAAVAAARGKESKGAMPEVAAWALKLTGLYEDVARSYWGSAQ